jgi:hypothetical protein
MHQPWYLLKLRSLHDPNGVPPHLRLRWALKFLKRVFRFECERHEPIPPEGKYQERETA